MRASSATGFSEEEKSIWARVLTAALLVAVVFVSGLVVMLTAIAKNLM